MTTTDSQVYHKAIFTDGSFVRIVSNVDPCPGEPIIAKIEWIHGRGTWPAEIIDAIIDRWQWYADWSWRSFSQAMTLPSGRVIHFRFRPMEPCESCAPSPGSIVGKDLFDAPPSAIESIKPPANYREALIAAMERIMPPERLAQVFGELPPEAQRRFAKKHLIDPPVRRITKINKVRR